MLLLISVALACTIVALCARAIGRYSPRFSKGQLVFRTAGFLFLIKGLALWGPLALASKSDVLAYVAQSGALGILFPENLIIATVADPKTISAFRWGASMVFGSALSSAAISFGLVEILLRERGR